MTSHHLSVTRGSGSPAYPPSPPGQFIFAAAALCLAASNRAVAAIYDGEPTSIVKAFAGLRPAGYGPSG